MNRIIIIALGALLVIGLSYQAKRSYDSHHASHTAGPNEAGQNPSIAQNVAHPNEQIATGTTANAGSGTAAVGAPGNGTISASGATHATSGNASPGTNGAGSASDAHDNSRNGQATGLGMAAHPTTATTAPTDGSAKTEKVATAPVKEKPKDNCFAFEYHHKKEAKDQDIENFLDYTNAFPVVHADFNPKSVCVKVNQKVVPFTLAKVKSNSEIRVGGLVGPESVIRVTYCTGKVPLCHEACDQPKKRFMDDLMSDAADDDSFSDSWGKDENHKKELKNKAKELRTIASENDHLNESAIQRDWDELQKQEWVCK